MGKVVDFDNSYILIQYTKNQCVDILVLSLCVSIFCGVVTYNCAFTFTVIVTQTILQIAKHYFSKTGITGCNGHRIPARCRGEQPSLKK
jgi:hypothetical protein